MKKLLLLSWCLLALALTGNAANFSVTTADLLRENDKDISRPITYVNIPKPLVYNGFDFLFDKGTHTGGPNWATRNGGYLSLTSGSTLKVSIPTGGTISEIKYTFKSGNTGTLSASTGTVAYDDASFTATWTGSASEVTFTNDLAGKHLYMLNIDVTYSAELPVSDSPSFNPAAGTYPDEVVVSLAAAPGAKIYYTTDGSAPTTESTEYTAAFKLETTTTVKAIAVEAGKDPSSAATAEYRVMQSIPCNNIRSYLNSISSLIGPDPNLLYTISGDVTVTFQSGNTLYVEDTTGALCITGSVGHTYQTGDVISNFSGTPYVAMNDPSDRRLTAVANTFGAAKSHVDYAYPEATFSDLHNDYNIARAYTLKNVYLSHETGAETAESFANAIFANGEIELLYNVFTGFPVKEGWFDIEGIMAKQTTESVTWLFYPTMFDPASGTQTATPALSVASGTYNDVQRVTVTAAEGAFVYYTTDGSTPTPASTLYEGPVTIEESCTLKVMAVVPGQTGSEVAEAEYVMDLKPQTAAPALVPGATDEPFVGQVAVTVEAAEGAKVYYSTDGTEPTTESELYTTPLTLTRTTTVKAIAIAEGERASAVAEATYTIKAEAPAFAPEAGEYENAVEVTIGAMEGMAIAYTTDGSEPTVESTVYTGPFTLTESKTVKAIAFGEGVEPSDVAEAAYVVNIKGGIEGVAVEAVDATAAYFDMQGRRVAKPVAGMLLIKVADNKATRVIVK